MPLAALCVLVAVTRSWGLRTAGRKFGDPTGTLSSSGAAAAHFVINQAVHTWPDASYSYRTFESARLDGSHDEHMQRYFFLRTELSKSPYLSHSRDILTYVSALNHAPSFTESGCLFLPTNEAWRQFYTVIERPYPPYFADMVAGAFFPDCGNVSLTGSTKENCLGNPSVLVGDHGCFAATKLLSDSGFHVFSTDGLVGLPQRWATHITEAGQLRQGHGESVNPGDACGPNSPELKEVPTHHKLVMPIRFIICKTSEEGHLLTQEMILNQVAWMNQAYSGQSPQHLSAHERVSPQQVDMQIEFEFQNVTHRLDEMCAKHTLSNVRYATRLNTQAKEILTVVIVGDDQTGMLGRSPLPTTNSDPEMHMVIVSASGIRNFAKLNPHLNLDLAYDEGDTIVHEAGHAFGLYHTFQDGCDRSNDLVADTEPEDLPHYLCKDMGSCGTSDPVHNFMDYTPDSCMSGFTEMQKRRAWCALRHYRPELFAKSLRLYTP